MTILTNRDIQHFKINGYTFIHIFGDFYLMRKYSKNYKKFSPYILVKYGGNK